MAVITSAVIAGLAALIGAGVSAYGASESADATAEEAAKVEAKRAKEFKEQMQLERQKQSMKGLEFLSGERDKMTAYSRTKSYNNPNRNNFRDRLLNMAGGL